ncbi:MAG: hypothetical protein CVT66_09235 [Actinobacteria bacterium HGW-Actinobacteria-6]|nr:MAG: hypothetical protein CVT66_09235 [Actinobacteria bacterium HGW-Actinobacteria-6]
MRVQRFFMALTAALIALLTLAACSPAPPKEAASISGVITTVTPGYGTLGSILVEGPAGSTSAYDKASVSITASTTLLRKTTDGYEGTSFADLDVGMSVDVWFTGPVAESYPVQATASALVVTK